MIRKHSASGYFAACDGVQGCRAKSRNVGARSRARFGARSQGWHVSEDGVTICPRCLELMKLGNLDNVQTGNGFGASEGAVS